MNLVIDIGNTATKTDLFSKAGLQESYWSETPDIDSINKILKNISEIENAIISATGHLPDDFIYNLKQQIPYVLEFSHLTKLPFTTKYLTPQTIGLDRLAAVAGAYNLYPGKAVLVIDAGTAITYDIKDENDEHLGGNISPGLSMRFKALNQFTARLPLVSPKEDFDLIGNQTETAIRNGIMNGILNEMKGMIAETSKIYRNLTVILTGGDTHFFDYRLKNTIFVLPKLVSTGLNTILNYNVATN